jgi:hypothetical protein
MSKIIFHNDTRQNCIGKFKLTLCITNNFMQVFFSIFWWIYFCMFFSGYPLIYVLFYLMSKNKSLHLTSEKIFPLLPVAYAFVATCFWILMIYTGRMNFVIERIALVAPSALAILYSFSALLFWLPIFRQNIKLSFLHSLPLFLLAPLNMLLTSLQHKIVHHDYISALFRIYTAGFLIYIIAITFLLAVKWLLLKTNLVTHRKSATTIK